MKKIVFIGLWMFLISVNAYGAFQDTLFNRLQQTIQGFSTYDAGKQASIQKIKQSLLAVNSDDVIKRADITAQLYDAYKAFNYDSALLYARKLQALSYMLQDRSRIVDAKIKISFVLISAALFKDAFDSLNMIHVQGLPDSIKAEYYSLMGRACYDLGDFNNDHVSTQEYYQKANTYIDSALTCFPKSSFEYGYYKGLRCLKTGELRQAESFFKNILSNQRLSFHQKALAESTLSGVYAQTGQTNEQAALLMQAAIDDIMSSTKETTATLYLASLLFKENSVKEAFICVEKTIQDAMFYGARQRQVQVSAILPIIENARINSIQSQRRNLIFYSSIITLLMLFLIGLMILIYHQNRKLKTAQAAIAKSNEIQQEINHKLMESNKIKEEYMVHSYNISTDFFSRMERLRDAIERKIHHQQYTEIKFLLNNMKLEEEKREMLASFDKIFLKLFPNFIDDFNSMFHEEDSVQLNEDGSLNTILRIFALIRMGITDNGKIAQILEYSVNTIYTYKTKTKKKALVSEKEFDEIIMQSKSL